MVVPLLQRAETTPCARTRVPQTISVAEAMMLLEVGERANERWMIMPPAAREDTLHLPSAHHSIVFASVHGRTAPGC